MKAQRKIFILNLKSISIISSNVIDNFIGLIGLKDLWKFKIGNAVTLRCIP